MMDHKIFIHSALSSLSSLSSSFFHPFLRKRLLGREEIGWTSVRTTEGKEEEEANGEKEDGWKDDELALLDP